MPLPRSGAISLQSLANEFGGGAPHALNEYYAGAGLVPAGTAGTTDGVNPRPIPSSGAISLNNFYGAPLQTALGTYSLTNSVVVSSHTQAFFPDNGGYFNWGKPSQAPPSTTLYSDSSNWLYDAGSGAEQTFAYWANTIYPNAISTYYLSPNINTITIEMWGGGGGAGGAWAYSGHSYGGSGGYCITTIQKNIHYTAGHYLHIVAGHAGSGGWSSFFGGWGGGASFAWTTTTSLYDNNAYGKILSRSLSNIICSAGGGGGGGATNVFSSSPYGYGGGGGTIDSGGTSWNYNLGAQSGGILGGAARHGLASSGPDWFYGAGAAGGSVGYQRSSISQMAETHPRNLIVTVPQTILLASQTGGYYVIPASGGGGVFGGASGTSQFDISSYDGMGRGGGGGATKIYKGINQNQVGQNSYIPYNSGQSQGKGQGGNGQYSSDGGTYPSKSGNNGTGGLVKITLS
jgi:hypothetical protein